MTARVVLLAGPGASTEVVANALVSAFGDAVVVIERPISRAQLLRRRIRRLGVLTVVGQVLFMLLAVPILAVRSHRRVTLLHAAHALDRTTGAGRRMQVRSVNSDEVRALLRELDPDVIVINGTRILDTETLTCVSAPFLNLHAGVTPQYRGVHGAYWALRDGRPDLAGATVHVVDAGIDTGPVLSQPLIEPSSEDNFVTYPVLQLAAGLPALVQAAGTILNGRPPTPVAVRDGQAPSRLHSHPTAWGYLLHRIRDGVR